MRAVKSRDTRPELALRQMLLWTDSAVVVKPEVIVFRSHERFDEEGNLIDPDTIALVQSLLQALRVKICEREPAIV